MMATALLNPELTWPEHAARSADPDALSAILMPGINLAIWERKVAPEVPDVKTLAEINDISLTAEADQVGAAMILALKEAGYPAEVIGPLTADIAAHANRLAQLLVCDTLAIRLEVIETDACRRFHADYVSVRLILTYVGPGTQWLDNVAAIRLRNGAAVETLDVRNVSAGQIALFKGRKWSPDGAIVHRSPPIADTGQRRLVLVIDPALDAQIPHE